MKTGRKKMASSSFYILDVVSYQDLSRPSASLAHCCIRDNLYFLAYFAFLNHKCKTKATKTNQVEKKLLKKAVSTALWIHMILFPCYLPFFLFLFFCRCWFYLFRCMEHAVLHDCVMLSSLILDRKFFFYFYCLICYERDRWKI